MQREHQLKLGTPGINGQTGGGQLTIRTQTVPEQVSGQSLGPGSTPTLAAFRADRLVLFGVPRSWREAQACRTVVMPVRSPIGRSAERGGSALRARTSLTCVPQIAEVALYRRGGRVVRLEPSLNGELRLNCGPGFRHCTERSARRPVPPSMCFGTAVARPLCCNSGTWGLQPTTGPGCQAREATAAQVCLMSWCAARRVGRCEGRWPALRKSLVGQDEGGLLIRVPVAVAVPLVCNGSGTTTRTP